jgi:hypothetical protein
VFDCAGVCNGDGNFTDGCDLIIKVDFEIVLYLAESGAVLYNSNTDIAGFQFNVDGATVSGTSGGDAAAAGFTVSAGGSTVLGFSFSGATVPVGCGTLTNLSFDGTPKFLDDITISNSNAESEDSYDCID